MATCCLQEQAVFRAPGVCGCGAGQSGALDTSEQASEGFMCVCVCERETERERDPERLPERQTDTERLRGARRGTPGWLSG